MKNSLVKDWSVLCNGSLLMSHIINILRDKIQEIQGEESFLIEGYELDVEQQYQILHEHLRLWNIGFGVPHDFENLGEAIKNYWFSLLESRKDKILAKGRSFIEQQLNEEYKAEPIDENMKVRITLPTKKKLSFQDLPEQEVDGLRIYGETSYENHIALLSHYLHNIEGDDIGKKIEKAEIINAIHEFLEYKKRNDKKNSQWDLSDDEIAQVAEDPAQYNLFHDFFDVPFPAPEHPRFTFIDLFAGIGGFRIAMQNLGGKCVYSSEFDAKAQESYLANYGEMPFGDITKNLTKRFIPEHFDILCGGFPCQAFSLAGKRLGFNDETRGTLFFEIEDILRNHKPKAFFLENVKGLVIHDKGRTIQTILEHLDNVGYDVVPPQVLNAMDYGVPQHRERVYIIGFRKDLNINIDDFHYPAPTTPEGHRAKVRDILESDVPSVKYYLSDVYVDTLKRHKARHEAAGHGFGYEIIDLEGVANAIVVGGMGRERNLIIDKRLTDFTPVTNIKGEVNRDGIRRMTPREWARLQGFPDEFKIVVADASAYKQFGNSVAIPAIQATAERELQMLGII